MGLRQTYERDLPGYRVKYDYADRTDGQYVYKGVAKMECGLDSPQWQLFKQVFDETGYVIDVVSTGGAWDERVSLFFALGF